jgi:hypothetical protein
MSKKNTKIEVKGQEITVFSMKEQDFISLTDIAKHKSDDPSAVIGNWMRNRNTIEFLGIWESLYNPDFKPLEFEGYRNQAGLNAFTLSAKKWTETTNAIGFVVKSGRYGGTFAHKDIALFGKTAKQWRDENPDKKGNIRDYANVSQLVCLANLENLNAVMIEENSPQPERLKKLNQIAIHQMKILLSDGNTKKLREHE